MNLKLSALVAAAVLAVGGAQAAVDAPSTGNGTVYIVAMDVNGGVGFVADLGLAMSAFTGGTMLTPGVTTWNFATNTTTLSTTGNDWSNAYGKFKSSQSGNDFVWAVMAGDSVSGGTIPGRGWLSTGNPTQTEMLAASTSTPTGTGLTNITQFFAAATALVDNTATTNTRANTTLTANNGAVNTTSADATAWLNSPGMQGTFGGQQTWNYLLGNGAVSAFNWQQQVVANPVIVQFGFPSNLTDLGTPANLTASFVFDLGTDTLTWTVVPEPGTYAMLLAGLAAVGFVARRRRQGA